MAAFVIARLTFREAARRRILWAALVLGLLFLGIYALGLNAIIKELARETDNLMFMVRNEILNFMMMAGLYVVNFLTAMMTVLVSVDTLSGEIASGTIHTLVSKPLRRWEIVLGKWVGFVAMLTLYILLMAGGVMLIVYLLSGYTAPNALRGLALLWLNALLLLSISLLGGAMFSTLANGVLVFGLYGVAFIGGWIEQVGSFLDYEKAAHNAVNIGIISSLIIPSEVLWKRAAFEMQSVLAGSFGGLSPFSTVSIPSPIMIGYAILYTLAVLALAVRRFRRRDL